ncbi:MAG: hypothetical protein M1147_11390 [Nitrospirae bacterium]|nr:hypothetical protein [Nitrospirota bacterium]
MIDNNAITIYLAKMEEVKRRLAFSEQQLFDYGKTKNLHYLENSILHLRKVLESIAYASIAPNKKAYSELRARSDKPVDFRKDYNGRKILEQLAMINKDFYPIPLEKPSQVSPNQWHFERKKKDFLTKKRFERVYDRLGKYLHSDNPWDNDKGYLNLAKELPAIYNEIRTLLSLHFTVIRDGGFGGIWVIEFGSNSSPSRVITAIAKDEFVVI